MKIAAVSQSSPRLHVQLITCSSTPYIPMNSVHFLIPPVLLPTTLSFHRNRMGLSHTQAFYLLVNNKSLASMSTTMNQIYEQESDDDGFLYMVYASHEFFGQWRVTLHLITITITTLPPLQIFFKMMHNEQKQKKNQLCFVLNLSIANFFLSSSTYEQCFN